MNRKVFLALALLAMVSLAAFAHDTWLTPGKFVVQPGAKVTLDLTSGMAFPLLESAIKLDRIDVAKVRLNGQTKEIDERRIGPKSLKISTSLKEDGIATVWIDLKPRQLELQPNLIEEYFSEINASAEIRDLWAKRPNPKRWREVYVKHAKTFVRVGQTSDESWREPVGMTLELVPEKDPTTLRANDDFVLRVLRNGSPLARFQVGIVQAGTTHGEFQTTDGDGRVTFRLKKAGKYMLRGTDLRPSSKSDVEWESDFTTLTIEVH